MPTDIFHQSVRSMDGRVLRQDLLRVQLGRNTYRTHYSEIPVDQGAGEQHHCHSAIRQYATVAVQNGTEEVLAL